MAALDAWDSFYVIVGSAGGALIGLQFVVMTLIAERPPLRVADAGSAFTTPGTVHFSMVLLVSALLRVPWPSMLLAAVACGLIGAAGAVYTLVVARRMRSQTTYAPDLEDWCFHFLLPLTAYAALTVSAFASLSHGREALFGIAGGVLLLLFTGIHNTWDGIVFFVFTVRNKD
ncbi:MAG TPA: hypothetical protein VLC74_09540 [Rhizomicrobium sp.]|nr:hypothetical protein [Rhizomicrobium sp.]